MALKLGELVTYLRADDTALARGLASAQDKLQAAGEKAREYGPLIGGALAAGIGAGLVGALDADKAKAKLSAQLGGDAQYAADMGEIAGNVYGRGFGESLEAVNETLRGVLGSGLLDEDATNAEIESVTLKAQALADTFGQDVTQTARAAGQMVRTGLAKDSAEAFDILTRGFQQTGDHAGDLLDTFSEYSVQFQKMGIDGTTATGLLSQGLKAGARDADSVADAVKEFSLRAVDGSKTTSDALATLGLNADTVASGIAAGGPKAQAAFQMVLDKLRELGPESTTTQQAIQGLFGGPGENLGGALLALDLDTAAKSMGDVSGAADKMGETLEQSASQRLESFKRSAQAALVEKIGQAIPYIESLVGWIDRHSAVVGPAAAVLGTLALVIGTVIGVVKLWTIAQTALNLVLSMNPIGLVVLAIAALVAGIVLIASQTDIFSKMWKAAWGGIKSAASAVGSWFRDTLWQKWILGAWNGIINKGNQALDWFQALPGRLRSALSGAFDGLKSAFRSAINWVIGRWNNFSLTLGGGSILGMGIPSVTLNTPNIPMLAKGAVVPKTRGGRLTIVGEGREDEAVMPLSKLNNLVREARQDGTDRNGQPIEVHVYLGTREIEDLVDVRIKKSNAKTARKAGPRTKMVPQPTGRRR
ncbi:putative phage tail protein [Actinoplanes missouriensis 431]|uniref:Putative phage tail protein n=1 Tax=Actinoplanes missouriensis (strain ATCC 14538 / DSM 43046 / CBS 188.64 / JCM 3121 / NBRC 102363 / NCIMB 12654 / NRRL B-3342 / UNCC 431) TaxID=512565 RepID=I0GXH4_ACTM4|nr:phage tail tape measure protein [Actinoplanes missouriensis]BAL85461.1 putative phage tail protein [Actinoplanes missouriensis 431]